jgi:stress-induced-phosphoprotein 1
MSSAADFKAKGNAALQAGDFDDAIDAYTEAIELDATNHVFYSNRSAAYLSNDNGEAALADAELCIQTKGDWAKGFNRKGAALHHLGRLEDAIAAFEEGTCPYCWQGLTLFSVVVL